MKRTRITRCKYCGSEYNQTVGLHNWKNLFRKPTIDDWITLFIIMMVLFSLYAYKQDTALCRQYIKEQQENFVNLNITDETNYTERIGFNKEVIEKLISNQSKKDGKG